jgi:hypothetical protein
MRLSSYKNFHINGVPSVCTAAIEPRAVVGACVMARGTPVVLNSRMAGAKTWAFLGVGAEAFLKALHNSLVPTMTMVVSAVPHPEGVVMEFPPLISGGSSAH